MLSRYAPPTKNTKRHLISQEFGKEFERVQPGLFAPVVLNIRPNAWTEALFGLMPYSAGPGAFEATYNARLETVGQIEPYRSAWIQRQLCVIPVQYFCAPSYESGSFVLNSIERKDGDWFFIAGLWDVRGGRAGDMFSFASLTLDAGDHPLMSRFGKGREDKRMPVVLNENDCHTFLNASTDAEILRYCIGLDAEGWTSTALESAWRKKESTQDDSPHDT